jgi:hypothetical protein
METPGMYFVSKRVVIYEIIAFALIILFLWLNEVIDIPFLLLGAEATPLNWRESLFESAGIIILGAVIIGYTNKMFQRMKYLEGLLAVCASCKKIRDEKGNWHQIESYIRERSEVEFSHSICPECAERLYPDYYSNKKMNNQQNQALHLTPSENKGSKPE